MFGCALWLAGCEDDPVFVVGVGQLWAYSTPNTSAVTADYRELSDYIASCPPSVAIGDNCRYSRCRYALADLPPPQPAGTITLTGGLDDVVLEPQEDNRYRVDREQPLFTGGERMTFEIAGGGEIPPASITLVAPMFVTVTDPPMSPEPMEEAEEDPEGSEEPEESEELPPLVIDREGDLKVTWTPIPEGTVRASVAVRQTFEDGAEVQDISFSCRFDAWLGTGVLEQENLKALPISEDPEQGSFWVGTEATGRTTTDEWEHWFGISAYESRAITVQ